jgi:glycerol-3-phosphate dehydrogenase
LITTAEEIIPSLKETKQKGNLIAGYYAGLRPATQFKEYQIESMKDRQWITVAGIRSTGVTASVSSVVNTLMYSDGYCKICVQLASKGFP